MLTLDAKKALEAGDGVMWAVRFDPMHMKAHEMTNHVRDLMDLVRYVDRTFPGRDLSIACHEAGTDWILRARVRPTPERSAEVAARIMDEAGPMTWTRNP